MYDIPNPTEPRLIGKRERFPIYPQGPFVVQGTTLYAVSIVRLTAYNIANPASPSEVYTYRTGGSSGIGAATGFAITNNLAFVVGSKGMDIVRLSRTSAERIGADYLTVGGDHIALHHGLAFVLSNAEEGRAGVHAVDVRDVNRPVPIGYYSHLGTASLGRDWFLDHQVRQRTKFDRRIIGEALVVANEKLLVAAGGAGLAVLDFTPAAKPRAEAWLGERWPGGAQQLVGRGQTVYGGSPDGELLSWDLGSAPRLKWPHRTGVRHVAFAGSYLLVTGGDSV